jgi:hypothetical protein
MTKNSERDSKKDKRASSRDEKKAIRDLQPNAKTDDVKGGKKAVLTVRKAGGEQQEY